MISDKEMRKRIEDMSPQELLKASETFEALFDLVHQHDDNSIANTKEFSMQGNNNIDTLNATIAQLTAERDEWKADAERLIQLANFKNKRASEYFDLHQQLVEKYGGEK